jgi:DNA modification methylase
VNDYDHPTQKPVALIELALLNSSKVHEIVVDFFGWSGSTLNACEKTNRICYTMELEPHFVQVIIKRYHTYTKGQRDISCLNRDLDLTPLLHDKD